MKTYLVTVEEGFNLIDELSVIGKIEQISYIYNIYAVTTDRGIEDVKNIQYVKSVKVEDRATLFCN